MSRALRFAKHCQITISRQRDSGRQLEVMADTADCGDGRRAQGGRARDLHPADRPGARAAATYRSVCRRDRAKRRKVQSNRDSSPPTSRGSAIIGTRWCPASAVSCCASHSINGWRRSSLTTQRPVSNVVKDDLGHPLIECDARHETALARHQRVPNNSRAPRCRWRAVAPCFGLPASSPDRGSDLIPALRRSTRSRPVSWVKISRSSSLSSSPITAIGGAHHGLQCRRIQRCRASWDPSALCAAKRAGSLSPPRQSHR